MSWEQRVAPAGSWDGKDSRWWPLQAAPARNFPFASLQTKTFSNCSGSIPSQPSPARCLTPLTTMLIRQQRSHLTIHAPGDPSSETLGTTRGVFLENSAPYLLLGISKASCTFLRRMNICQQLGGISNIFILSKVFLCPQFPDCYLSFLLIL